MPAALLHGALAILVAAAPAPGAQAVLDTALARMGGRDALHAVGRVRLEVMTEWQRLALDARAVTPVLSYERSRELRDYARPAWRYTREFFTPGAPGIENVVVDSVAATATNGKWRPQNVAYVTERDEAFTFAPERVVLLAREAADARLLSDTTIAGAPHARVVATLGRWRPTLYFRRGDGTLALARFRAAQPDDFGLAPWGEMDVAIRYSRWQRFGTPAITIPTQLDVERVGRPYKRQWIVSMSVNPAIPVDTFAIPDSLRAAFLATARRPMYDVPLDSARVVDGRFAVFGAWGTPPGAVKLGGRWLVIEGGTAPLQMERSVAFLRRADPATPVAGALLTAATAAGGLPWLLAHALPAWVAPGARPWVAGTLAGWPAAGARPRVLEGDRWLRVGTDSLRVETVDLPDFPAATVLYAPALRWAYAWSAAGPVQMDQVVRHVRRRGWSVDRVGTARDVVGTPLAPATAAR